MIGGGIGERGENGGRRQMDDSDRQACKASTGLNRLQQASIVSGKNTIGIYVEVQTKDKLEESKHFFPIF